MIGSETIVRPMIDKQVLDSPDKERRPIEERQKSRKQTGKYQIGGKRQISGRTKIQRRMSSAIGLSVSVLVGQRSQSDHDQHRRMILGQVWREPLFQLLRGRCQL
jgi:hypothetical protein